MSHLFFRSYALPIWVSLSFLVLTSDSQSAWTDSVPVYESPINESSVADWENPDPETLEISFVPGGSSSGQGALLFKILKPITKRLEVRGPSFDVPGCSESAVRRTLPLSVRAKLIDLSDASVAISLLGPNGRPISSVAGNRDFETALVMNGSRYADWSTFDKNAGCVLRGYKPCSVRILIDFTSRTAPGEFWLESLKFYQKTNIDHKITSDAIGNVFFAEQGTVRILWANPDKRTDGAVRLTDEQNRLLSERKIPAGEKETEIPLVERGFYTISAVGQYQEGNVLETVSTAAVVGPPVPEPVRLQSRFGLMRCHMSEDFAVKLGSRWDSGAYNFNAIQQNPDGSLSSSFTQNANASGTKNASNPPQRPLKQIYSATGNYPVWLRQPKVPNEGLYPPNDWDKLGECVALWTKTNPSLPDVLGPYHEVDGAWKVGSDDLIRYHNVVSAAYKRARPDVPVAGPVFCNLNVPYFSDLVKRGILKDNDAINIHPYVNGSAPEGEFITEIIELKNFLKSEGLSHLPIYFTEFGWSSYENDWQKPVDSLTRGRYCSRSLILCAALDIKALVYFAGRFQEPEDVEHYWIVRSNYTPYPALPAYATAVRELSEIPGGQFFRLTPNLFLCTFVRNGNALWVLWTADGTECAVTLPERPIAVRSMTGTALKPSTQLTVTPSPTYVELANELLATVDVLEPQTRFPGSEGAGIQNSNGSSSEDASQTASQTAAKPEPSGAPRALIAPDAAVPFPDNAPVGNYTILTRKLDGTVLAQPVELDVPIEIAYKDFVWDGKTSKATLRFSVVNRMYKNTERRNLRGQATIQANFNESIAVPVSFSDAESVFSVSVPVETGVRQTGTAIFRFSKPLQRTIEIPFDFTPTSILYFADRDSDVDWSDIPAIPVNQWARPGDVRDRDKTETKATLQFYANRTGLRLRLTVADSDHRQRFGSWSFMANEDSIKLGFDFDADKDWEFNNIRFGYNGHRCIEYAISQTVPGGKENKCQNQWWTTRSWLETIKVGPAFNLIPGTKISRINNGPDGPTTVYDLTFRWKDLDASEPPKVGKTLGFSLVVYDKNDEQNRKTIPFGRGLHTGTPLDYGRVILTEP